jgi:hypothetical protein
MSVIEDFLAELKMLRESDHGPFPYEGCRWLRSAIADRHDGLVPDLDMYFSEIAGYRSWGKKILTWSDEKIATVESRTARSFFGRFPAYAGLKPLLQVAEASDVRLALQNADRTREVLLQLLGEIRKGRAGC